MIWRRCTRSYAVIRLRRSAKVALSNCGRTPAQCAFKFRDPGGNPLELLHFPSGRGDLVWQQRDVFFGIDHSAIVVADIAQSVDFYTRLLGLRNASRTLDSGRSQGRLDHAPGDVVEVVALQPTISGTPHVELLGYATPTNDAMLRQARANDVLADRLVMQVDCLTPLVDALRDENISFVSSAIAGASDGCGVVLVRDPSGHLLLLWTWEGRQKNPLFETSTERSSRSTSSSDCA